METSSDHGNIAQSVMNRRSLDWRAALLVIVLVQISSSRLVVTEWAPFLYFTQTMAFFGVILGLALGFSKFSRQAVMRLVTGYTLMLVPIQLLGAVERTDWLWQDILTLMERLYFSVEQFITNKPVYDHLFFVSIVTLTYWLIGLAAGYWLTRHGDFLNVVIPSGVAILVVQSFDAIQTKHIWELAAFLFVSLLLMGRMYFLKNRTFWSKTNFLMTNETMVDLERGTLVVAVVAVLVAWFMPGWINSVKPAATAWSEFSQPIFERFSNAVSALESPYAVGNERSEFYGSSLLLGEQAATGENIIFTVELKEGNFVPVRRYWKGRNYDLYLDGRWMTVEAAKEPFDPAATELTVEYPQDRHEMGFTFTSHAKRQKLLYAPAEAIWINKNANIQSVPIADGTKDITAWIAKTSLSDGDQYKVRALIADPTIEELRSAGTEYPDWVTERYLQVPEEIAQQLKELALEITAPYDTAYDKTQAITSFMRAEIEYQKTIKEKLPENRDPVLWVLFEYKKGFCMYYASAETLMLRSIGIPARMAVGFVEGKYDETEGTYTVTYEDSHAWPEVYFPGIGWVEFEPTSNQSPIERPETRVNPDEMASDLDLEGNGMITPLPPIPLDERPENLGEEDILLADTPAWYQGIIAPMLILLTLGFGIFIIHRYSLNDRLPVYLAYQYERRGNIPPRWLQRWVRWVTLSPVERSFQSINLSLSLLGKSQPAHVTSQERAEILIKRLPSAQKQTLSLLEEYHNAIYTLRRGNVTVARKAAVTILLKTWQTRIKETLQFVDSRYNQLK
jgi:transglutaminase-like putative cysteine protease